MIGFNGFEIQRVVSSDAGSYGAQDYLGLEINTVTEFISSGVVQNQRLVRFGQNADNILKSAMLFFGAF
jgi:hypothetical protein